MKWLSWLEQIHRDALLGFRSLSRDRRFTLYATLALAVGIGCSTTVFSVFNAVILQALPFPESDRLVAIWSVRNELSGIRGGLSAEAVRQIQEQIGAFEAVGSYTPVAGVTLSVDGRVEELGAARVSGDFFRTLGRNPLLGRWLMPGDTSQGVVISHSLWSDQFGADNDILGRTIHLNNQPWAVVGVMPMDFAFPAQGTQVWIPDQLSGSSARDRRVLARLKLGADRHSAQTELRILGARMAGELATGNPSFELSLSSLRDDVIGPVQRILVYLLSTTLLLLLITCANVANLILARNSGRRREFAIHMALGASGFQVVRRCFIEGVILAALGGAAGLFVAFSGAHVARTLGSTSIPRLNSASIDSTTLLFALSLCFLSVLFFGMVVVTRVLKADTFAGLKDGAFSSRAGFSVTRGRGVQSILLTTQIAFAVILSIGSVMMIRSLSHLLNVKLGFEPRNLHAVQLSPKFQDRRQLAYFRTILDAVSQIPGVESAAITTTSPLGRLVYNTTFSFEDRNGQWIPSPDIQFQSISPGYFGTMQIPVVSGRTFTDTETLESPCVVLINQIAARAFWPNEDSLGKRLLMGERRGEPYYCTVVGVVGDSRDANVESPPGPEVYFSDLQLPQVTYVLLFRTVGDAPFRVNSVVEEIREIDNAQPLRVVSVEQILSRAAIEPRFRAILVGFFAGLALLVTTIGVYAATSYSVGQRMHEMGIRIALGAQPHNILYLVLRNTLLVLSAGIVLGIGGAIAGGRLIESLLFDVRPTDPISFLTMFVVVVSVALLASYFPARQAIKADPKALLRCD